MIEPEQCLHSIQTDSFSLIMRLDVSRTIYCKAFKFYLTLSPYLYANILAVPRKRTLKTEYINSFEVPQFK